MNGITKLRTIVGHAAHARYLAGLSPEPLGWIPRVAEIPSPYAYSPEHVVWSLPAKALRAGWGVFWVETKHRHYTFYSVDPAIVRPMSESNLYTKVVA